MKGLLLILLLAGFGFWAYTETQKEKDLQTSLDESKLALQDAQKQLQQAQQQLQLIAARQAKQTNTTPKNWMWDPKNASPLGSPAASGVGQKK